MDILQKLTVIDQNNFPESVRKMYIINAPSVFNVGWKILKPSLDKRILSKLAIGNYKDELRAIIPVEELPTWAGGENNNVAVPPAFAQQQEFAGEDDDVDLPDDALERLKIPRGEKIRIPIKIKSKNTKIFWKFIIEEHDIAFFVNFKRNEESEEKIVIESKRLEGSHQGSYLAKRRGTYTLVFDNSFSVFTKKAIKYQTYTQKIEKEKANGDDVEIIEDEDQNINTEQPNEDNPQEDPQDEDN